jgi:hypothetical protein
MSQNLQRIKNLTFLLSVCSFTLLFVIKNNEIFPTNNEIYSIGIRNNDNSQPLLLHLTKAQKGVYFSASEYKATIV